MIVAGVADRAVGAHGLRAAGTSVTADRHVDLTVAAHCNFVELRTGLPCEQVAYQLTASDARRLAQALIDEAEKVDGIPVEICSGLGS